MGVADSSRSSWRLRAARPVKGDQVLAPVWCWPISRFDDANERCKASNQPNLLSASFRSMRPSTPRSMFNGI